MKHFLTTLIISCSYLLCIAQATSLSVDIQTPGWLSSKINYGDQQTVENLTVTGFINQTDISFIGSLMEKHHLNGHLDLTDAVVVDTEYADGVASNEIEMFNLSHSVNIRRLSLPTSISHVTPYLLACVMADTLDYGSTRCNTLTTLLSDNEYKTTNTSPKVLILREGVSKIERFYTSRGRTKERLLTVILPQTLDSIGDSAFKEVENLSSINLPDNIHTIGKEAFANTSISPDSLYLPKSLKEYHSNAFPIKDNQVIILGNNVEQFNNSSWVITKQNKVTFIINRVTPPLFINGFKKDWYSPSYSDGKELSGCTIYVPKEGYSMYRDSKYNSNGSGGNPYSFATIKTIPIHVKEILLNTTSETINVGSSLNLIASIQPNNADIQSISWESSNNAIASVNASGLVKAISKGKAIIKAISNDTPNIFACCEITVHQPVQAISLEPKALSLNVGESFDNLTVTITPVTADNKNLIWQSSNPSIATVDNNGKINALQDGELKITVSSEENPDIKDDCLLTVVQPVTGISINKSSIELHQGESEQLLAIITPQNATEKHVNWISSDISTAMISTNGTVYAIKPGQATIMATTVDGGFVALCKVTVKPAKSDEILINKIILNPASVKGVQNESIHIDAIILPENATNKTLKWSSSDNDIATIDDGILQLKKIGTAIIIATSTDGTNVSGNCTVIVSDESGIESIIKDKDSYVRIFNLQGYQIFDGKYSDAQLCPGLYIILYNGTSYKTRID